jgi:transcriptional regulator with XRE-family HTH domain
MSISSEQLRAARALLRWEQRQLAEASGVSLPSVKRLETQRGPLAAHEKTTDALVSALEAAGVTFLADGETAAGGPGVRLKDSTKFATE